MLSTRLRTVARAMLPDDFPIADTFEIFADISLNYLKVSSAIRKVTVEGTAAFVTLQVAESFPSPDNCCSPSVIIVQMAYSINVHRHPSYIAVDSKLIEIRGGLWYTIISLDHWLAANTNRPANCS